MKKRLYLAYGSNLNKAQMAYRCPDATVLGTAALVGWELLFKGSKTGSYLTVERREGSQVPVAVWEVSEADERALDRYEGCPRFYYKKTLVLPVLHNETDEIRRRRCFVYIMHEDRPEGMPYAEYVRTCRQGYRDFGFSQRYLDAAVERAWYATQGRMKQAPGQLRARAKKGGESA